MFDGLSEIDWSSLTHAYGPADDVPDMIRRLGSQNPETREDAIDEAYGNVFHQGTRYQATSYTVPFLLELLADEAYPGKPDILYLLAHMVMGYDEYYLPHGFAAEIADWRAEHAESDDEEGEWLGYLIAITDEVRKGAELYNDLLAHDDDHVRVATTFLMSWLPEEGAVFLPHLWARAKADTEPDVRASAVIALGLVADDELFDEYVTGITEKLESPDHIERFGAAIALGTRRPDECPDAVTQVLLEGIVSQDDERTMSLPWYSGEHGAYAAEVLRLTSQKSPARVVRAVAKALPSMHTFEAANASTTVLAMLFDEPVQSDRPLFNHLQREFLESLASTHTPWKLGDAAFVNFTSTMRTFGLPDSRSDLRSLLESTSEV